MKDVIIEDLDEEIYIKEEPKKVAKKEKNINNRKKNSKVTKNKKKNKKVKLLNICLSIVLIVLLIMIFINTFLIFKYDVLPFKYLIIYLILVVILPIGLIIFGFLKKTRKGLKIFALIIGIMYITLLSFSFYYLNKTFSFLDHFTSSYNYETKNYMVLVLKDSNYSEITDLKDKKIGYVKSISHSIDDAINDLEREIKYEHEEYLDYESLLKSLNDKEIDAILLGDSYYHMLSEENETFKSLYKEVYSFSLTEKVEEIKKEADVTSDTFNIYISGIDSYGSVLSLTRSDVNILVSVNPKTNQILLVNIPRDYYVEFPGTNQKDKLTHAGIYGLDMSVKAIENLLDIEVNYYLKVNYAALVNLVDALGGVDVYSKYSFTSVGTDKDYYYKKGYNYVNGEKALYFVRTRKAFEDGDRARGENQQAMIQAIIKKAMSPAILTKYTDILNSLKGSFTTNMSTDKITDIIKMQLEDMKGFEMTSIGLSAKDGNEYTYTYPYQKLYVMIPDIETIENAKDSLEKINKGQSLKDKDE